MAEPDSGRLYPRSDRVESSRTDRAGVDGEIQSCTAMIHGGDEVGKRWSVVGARPAKSGSGCCSAGTVPAGGARRGGGANDKCIARHRVDWLRLQETPGGPVREVNSATGVSMVRYSTYGRTTGTVL
jgi:hypothetical protein